jgi:hypothetical protein
VCETPGNKVSELRITQAYINLLLAPEIKDGERTVSLVRIGSYEVRLVEVPPTSSEDAPPLWMELYDHNVQSAIDSCSCHEIEEAMVAAEHLVWQARCMKGSSQCEEARCNTD